MKNDLSKNNISKLFLKLLPVQIFMCITSSLSSLVNGLVIGNNLSNDAMVALGFVVPLVSVFTSISAIISGGAGILCGKYMGSGEKKMIDKVFSNSIILIISISLLLTLGCEVFASPIASLLGANEYSLLATATYIRGLAIGNLPTMTVPCLMIFLQMCNESNFSLIATILLAVFNYIFGVLNINIFKGGIFGIGIATSLSQYLVLLVIVVFLAIKKHLKFNIKEFELNTTLQIFKFGFPAALAAFLYSVRNVYINKIASNTAGELAISAIAIFGSVGGLFDAFNIGIQNATKMLASVFVGERDSNSLKKTMKFAVKVGLILAFSKVVIIFVFGGNIAQIFGGQGEIIDATKNLLIYYSYAMPFNIFFVVIMAVYQCFGRFTYCNVLYVITCIVAPLSCCVIASKFMGINGVWLCYLVAELVILTVVYVVCCIKNKGLVKNLDGILYIDATFDIKDKYSKSINNINEVINISKDIEQFCRNENIDKRRSMFAGLCIEEMAGNIVEHGFEKDNKKHTIDIFVGIENNEISIRLRDDCIGFDPNSKLQMLNPEDPCKNIGIKMVSKIAKELNYQTTFGMNVLTIKL